MGIAHPPPPFFPFPDKVPLKPIYDTSKLS